MYLKWRFQGFYFVDLLQYKCFEKSSRDAPYRNLDSGAHPYTFEMSPRHFSMARLTVAL